MDTPKRILPIIVLAQFCCTSLWFVGNALLDDLISQFALPPNALGHITSAVQLGFIAGTLSFALLALADRVSPSKLFCISAVCGAVCNLCLIWQGNELLSILLFRFLTGFFLAGVYPVGMKIAADHFDAKLGKSIGLLVGALVVGTAFPHLLNDFSSLWQWQMIVIAVSALALVGGLIILLLVPDGPFRQASHGVHYAACWQAFKNPPLRAAACGYFGHMWELYTFWAFIPLLLENYTARHTDVSFAVPLLSFMIIGMGGLACMMSGYAAQRFGTKRLATVALSLSGLCCLLSPLLFAVNQVSVFVAFLLFWGVMVVADSPLFSTLISHSAPREIKGTLLTIINCIGYAITIVSIQLITSLNALIDSTWLYLLFALGPVLGVAALLRFGARSV